MSEKEKVEIILSQLEYALEERQSNDRRNQTEAIIPQDGIIERRLTDRRIDEGN